MQKSGFSLIELSIVLVILGLLAAGILSGQGLIRAAEIRNITEDFSAYQTSVFTFKSKYHTLPGDMLNATAFWGSADADPDNCKETIGTGTQTCNGSGDGIIGGTFNDNGSNEEHWERFRAWQHLANAGLIAGTFTGVAGAGHTNDSEVEINIPGSAIGNAGFSMWSPDTTIITGDASFFDGNYRNIITFGTENMPHGVNQTAAIKAEEAWNIDKKIDDGMPATGKVTSYKAGGAWAPNCTMSDLATSEYNVSVATNECSINLKLGL